jgi:hypothetical protein
MITVSPARVFFILILSFSTFLIGCGGGNNSSKTNKNSIEGRGGILTRITNLGVAGVNDTMTLDGIIYTTDTAVFSRSDTRVTIDQSDFNLGETVIVEGVINPNGKTGTATRIIFNDAITGNVTKVVDGSLIEILGQQIVTDDKTVFHGFDNLADLADLKEGQQVQISGTVDKNKHIFATSIRVITEDGFIVRGYISNHDESAKTFLLDNLSVDYSSLLIGIGEEPLKNGFYVEIISIYPLNNGQLIGTVIDVLNTGALKPNTFHNMTGSISRFNSLEDFDINGLPITTTEQSRFTHTSGVEDASEYILRVNTEVIISGSTNAKGILEIDELTLVTESSTIFTTGLIEAIDYENKTVSVLGVTASIRELTSTLVEQNTDESITFVALQRFSVGDFVSFTSYRNVDNEHIISELIRMPFEFFDLLVLGAVFSSDEQLGVINLMGHRIETNSNTEYEDNDLNTISKQTFFSEIATKNTTVVVYGEYVGENTIKADYLMISHNL